jgi:hypothetical protein
MHATLSVPPTARTRMLAPAARAHMRLLLRAYTCHAAAHACHATAHAREDRLRLRSLLVPVNENTCNMKALAATYV